MVRSCSYFKYLRSIRQRNKDIDQDVTQMESNNEYSSDAYVVMAVREFLSWIKFEMRIFGVRLLLQILRIQLGDPVLFFCPIHVLIRKVET